MRLQWFEDRLTSLEDSEMEMFRFLMDRPSGVILSNETDILLARILASEGLAALSEDNIALIPEKLRTAYADQWNDELELRWHKRNWMYKCIETAKYLYGVLTWEVLGKLFAVKYPDTDMEEIMKLFYTTPEPLQWLSERGDRLVVNGFEKDDFYKSLEGNVQRNIPYYIPSEEEIEELCSQGSLVSRKAHNELLGFISETFSCDKDIAALKLHELYEAVNNRIGINDAADAFSQSDQETGIDFTFPSDEQHVKFIDLYIRMSRECRIRDNRGHDYYEMVGIMAKRNREAAQDASGKPAVKRVKIGRNDPCPCGSGKKYKNCCGRG